MLYGYCCSSNLRTDRCLVAHRVTIPVDRSSNLLPSSYVFTFRIKLSLIRLYNTSSVNTALNNPRTTMTKGTNKLEDLIQKSMCIETVSPAQHHVNERLSALLILELEVIWAEYFMSRVADPLFWLSESSSNKRWSCYNSTCFTVAILNTKGGVCIYPKCGDPNVRPNAGTVLTQDAIKSRKLKLHNTGLFHLHAEIKVWYIAICRSLGPVLG